MRIDSLEAQKPRGQRDETVAEAFALASRDKSAAAQLALGYLEAGGNSQSIHDAARRLVFLKGTDSHDYKFSSAILEDAASMSPTWRNRALAAGMMLFRGSGGADSPLVERARAAIANRS
jgi:hypothetical protein